jgi:hypothetical protein
MLEHSYSLLQDLSVGDNLLDLMSVTLELTYLIFFFNLGFY